MRSRHGRYNKALKEQIEMMRLYGMPASEGDRQLIVGKLRAEGLQGPGRRSFFDLTARGKAGTVTRTDILAVLESGHSALLVCTNRRNSKEGGLIGAKHEKG